MLSEVPPAICCQYLLSEDLDPVLPEPKVNNTPAVCVFGRLRDVSELDLEVVPVGLRRSPKKPLRDVVTSLWATASDAPGSGTIRLRSSHARQ
jgi:hypothetical protein